MKEKKITWREEEVILNKENFYDFFYPKIMTFLAVKGIDRTRYPDMIQGCFLTILDHVEKGKDIYNQAYLFKLLMKSFELSYKQKGLSQYFASKHNLVRKMLVTFKRNFPEKEVTIDNLSKYLKIKEEDILKAMKKLDGQGLYETNYIEETIEHESGETSHASKITNKREEQSFFYHNPETVLLNKEEIILDRNEFEMEKTQRLIDDGILVQDS